MCRGRSYPEYRDEGRFDGPRVDCEQVPLLPAWAVTWVLDDPRKIPYLFVWKRPEDSSVREAVRVSAYSGPPSQFGWAEVKRSDGTRDRIRTLLRPLPRNGGKARLLVCPYCQIPRRGLHGWELDGFATVVRSTWGCRRCNSLRYAAEGGALVIRSRWAFARLLSENSAVAALLTPSRGSLACSPHLKRRRKPVFLKCDPSVGTGGGEADK